MSDVSDLRERAEAFAPRELPFEWASEIDDSGADEIREIVEDVLTAGGLSCAYGESNSGKSYCIGHLAFCIARGVPWLGKRVERGAVIYVAAEGAASIRRRIRAYRKRTGARLDSFGLVSTSVNLLAPSIDLESLLSLIREKASEIGEAVLLVVVDTLARVIAGGDENSGEDMGRLVAAGDLIRHETGAHVLFVHHSGKNALLGARGHSSLRAALDTELEVTKDEAAKLHFVEVKKQRDLATIGTRLSARFEPVELGRNQWGKPITACVVEDAGETETRAPRSKPRGAIQRLVLSAVEAAINLHGRHPQGVDFRKNVLAATLGQVRKEFDLCAGQIEPKHRSTRFAEGMNGLKASGFVLGVGDWVWLPNLTPRFRYPNTRGL